MKALEPWMEAGMDLNQNPNAVGWKTRLFWLIVRTFVVVGFFKWVETAAYKNFIFILHFVYWPLAIFIVPAMFAAILLGHKVNNLTGEAREKGVKSLYSLHRIHISWVHRMEWILMDLPFMGFIGIFMGDWSLFVPVCLAEFSHYIMMAVVSAQFVALPDEFKEIVMPKDKLEKDMKNASTPPLQRIVEDIKAAKAAQDADDEKIVEELVEEIDEKSGGNNATGN